MKSIAKHKIELESLKIKREQTNSDYRTLSGKMYKETRAIEVKFEVDLTAFKSTIGDLDNQIRSMHKAIRKQGINEEWQDAISREEISEFYLAALLKKCNEDNFNRRDLKEIKLKQTLKNGIDIWMVISEEYNNEFKIYFAFVGVDLLGVSFRHTPKHAGDETRPFSFIGQFDQPLQTKKPTSWDEDNEVNSTFQKWIRELKKLKQSSFKLMVMNDEIVQEIKSGIHQYWSHYSWEDKKPKEVTE